MAHRGGARETSENTRAGFEYAVSLGYVYLESDIQVTRDGVAVLFHDPKLDRTTRATGSVSDYTWEQLRRVSTDAGVDQIMRVDDALISFPAQKFNLDLKCEAAVDAFVAIMDSTCAYDRVLASSFSDDRLRRVRKRLGPRLVTSAGPREVGKFLAGAWGVRHRTSGPMALQIPSTIKGVPVVTPALVKHAHKRGLQVHVWTIDDPTEMTRLLDLGIDGIMTDRPSALKNLLVARSSWGGLF
ncbi:unannotated protein [freshwater metagenome]|uniref:Unannotated protein n=1 Tax=freshwater metagenome TaxID=449393 RepID=A0A6J7I7Y9_9ZZZZ